MKFILSKESELHPNYVSHIVYIKEEDFSPHPNPEVNALKRCNVGTDTLYNVIVSMDAKPGKYVFFPVNSRLNPEFLSYANLYKNPEFNANPDAKHGMFEDNGRVKSIRIKGSMVTKNEETGENETIYLAGSVSDGFLIELSVLLNFILSTLNIKLDEDSVEDGTTFDTVEHDGKTFWLSKKYVIPHSTEDSTYMGNQRKYKKSQRGLKKFLKLVPGQFRYHYETTIIKECPFVVKPDDYIHISGKMHGTAVIFSYILCKQPLNWKQKIAKFLTGEEFNRYDYLYSSRRVILNKYITEGVKKIRKSYYETDIYGEAFKAIKDKLIKGMTIYAEIVGFEATTKPKYIQKPFDYGCVVPKQFEEYTCGKHYKIYVYRITMTNVDGIVTEFSPREVQFWCKENGLVPVPEYYYGKAKDLYPDINIDENWHKNFWERMANDKNFYMELDSPDCKNKVPHEGVVIKIDDMIPRAFKLKTFRFLSKEQKDLDDGITNIEDALVEDEDEQNENE